MNRRHLWEYFWMIAAILFSMLPNLSAKAVNLAWDPHTDARVTGFKLHYGRVSGQYTNTVDAGFVTTFELPLESGVHYIAATAYGAPPLADSGYSNEIVWAPLPGPLKDWQLKQ